MMIQVVDVAATVVIHHLRTRVRLFLSFVLYDVVVVVVYVDKILVFLVVYRYIDNNKSF